MPPKLKQDAARPVDVIAHRGASADAPENTLAAFELAIAAGVRWIELDCHRSADGEIVVIHDDTLERTTNGRGAVGAAAYADLRRLDAGAWFGPRFAGQRIPRLDACLELAVDPVGVYLEVKSLPGEDALARALFAGPEADGAAAVMAALAARAPRLLELTRACIAALRRHGLAQRSVLQSFSPLVCLAARVEAPDLHVGFLGPWTPDQDAVWEQYLRVGAWLGVPSMNVDVEALSPGRLAMLREGKRRVAVWTVDDPAVARRLAGWGVDSVITNRPGAMLSALAPDAG